MVDPKNRQLFEFYSGRKTDTGWTAAQASIFDLSSTSCGPDGWTSTDAAGLPVFPSVIRFDEVERGMVEHAMRFTIRNSRRAYVYPATHHRQLEDQRQPAAHGRAVSAAADFDISGFSPHVQADAQGTEEIRDVRRRQRRRLAISVAPDSRIKGLDELRRVKGKDFEVIEPTGR